MPTDGPAAPRPPLPRPAWAARAAALGLALSALGCGPRERPPPVPVDASFDASRPDTGFGRVDSATGDADAGDLDAADPDAGDGALPDGGAPDGGDGGPDGGVEIVVDGVLSPGEWDAAPPARSSTPTVLPAFALDALQSVRALRDGTYLYVAIEGSLTVGNAIVMYVDARVGGIDGLINTSDLSDLFGDLDLALTEIFITPAELRVDFGWGVLEMPRATTGTDPRLGWRDIATNPVFFTEVTEDAPSACSASACETRIPLATLGAVPADSIGLFVRLVSATGSAVSNQTLPLDDPLAPEVVGTFLEVAP